MMVIGGVGMVSIAFIVQDRPLPRKSLLDEPESFEATEPKRAAEFRFVPSAVREGA